MYVYQFRSQVFDIFIIINIFSALFYYFSPIIENEKSALNISTAGNDIFFFDSWIAC